MLGCGESPCSSIDTALSFSSCRERFRVTFGSTSLGSMRMWRAERRDREPWASRSPTARVAEPRSYQAARPRGGKPAVDRARVALGPKALDIPTRSWGVGLCRRPHHGAVPATDLEFPAPTSSCARSPPGVNHLVGSFARLALHVLFTIFSYDVSYGRPESSKGSSTR